MHRDKTSLGSYASPELFYLGAYMHQRRYETVLERLFQDRLYEFSSLGRELIQTVLEQTVQDRLHYSLLHKEESFCAQSQKLSFLSKRLLLYTVAGARPTTVYTYSDGLGTSVSRPSV